MIWGEARRKLRKKIGGPTPGKNKLECIRVASVVATINPFFIFLPPPRSVMVDPLLV